MNKQNIASFKKNRENIIDEWSSLVHKSTKHYKELSLKDTRKNITNHLHAILDVLETQLAFLHGQTVILRQLDRMHGQEKLFCLDFREITDLFIKTQVLYSNIFKEKQLEQKTDSFLRELELKDLSLSSLTDSTPDAVIGLDENFNIRSWDKGAEVMYQYKANEIINKPIEVLVPEEHRDEGELYNIEMILRRSGFLKNYKTERIRKDGKKLIVNISSTLLKDTKHNIIGFSSLHHDLTEKIQLEQEIRSQEKYLSSIVDHSADAIVGLDLNDNIVSWNKGAENIFGYTKKEAVGNHFQMLLPPEAIKSGELNKIDDELKKEGSIRNYEAERIAKNGKRIVTSLTRSLVRDKNDTVIGSSAILRDITEYKKLIM